MDIDYSSLYTAVEQVESGGNPLAVSPKGATGPMQTMPATLADPGYGVAPARDSSIEEKRRVGRDYLKAMVNKYQDLPTALAAYNWGPGAVDKWKADGSDMAKLPKETAAYIPKVQKLMGKSSEVLATNARSLQPTKPAELAAIRADANRKSDNYVADRPTFLEMAGAAIAGSTGHVIANAIMRDRFEPEAGFVPDAKLFPPGGDQDLAENFFTARSKPELDNVLADWEDEQLRLKTVGDRGVGPALMLGLGAELVDPINFIVPFGATKALSRAGLGSEALFAAGRTQAGFNSAMAENVLSGTALEAVKQSVTGEFSPLDLGISLVADGLIGAGSGFLGARHAAARTVERAGEEAVRRESDLVRRAQERIGEGAEPEALRAEMKAIHAEDIKATATMGIEDVPEEAKLLREEQIASPSQADQNTDTTQALDVETPAADFDTEDKLTWREAEFAVGGKYESQIGLRTGGKYNTLAELKKLGSGIHYGNVVSSHFAAVDTVIKLAKRLLPDSTIVFHSSKVPMFEADGKTAMKGADGNDAFANADIMQIDAKTAIIRVDPNLSEGQAMRSVVHETGHAIFNRHIAKLPEADRAKLTQAFVRFLQEAKSKKPDGNEARAMRYSITNDSMRADRELTAPLTSKYELDWDEFSAEQFVKYVEELTVKDNQLGLSRSVVSAFIEALHAAMSWLRFAKRKGLGVTNEYREFFETILNDPGIVAAVEAKPRAKLTKPKLSQNATGADIINELQADPDLVRFGLATAPVNTPEERANVQAMLALHKQAEQWAVKNPKDAAWDTRAQNLADNEVFNVASIGMIMLKSPSPLLRMIASRLVEDASGITGKKQATAAIAKATLERGLKGNFINDYESAYAYWSKGRPGVTKDNWTGGTIRKQFDIAVAEEIEQRRATGGPVSTDPSIKGAADVAQAVYQRAGNEMRRVGTLGSDGIPKTSVGYMPHRMSAKAVINLTNEQTGVVHSALTDQFVALGWDTDMADKVASNYIQRMRDRAGGDYGSDVGTSNAVAVRDVLVGMKLPIEVIDQQMEKFTKGGAGFTKGRIELDLLKVYPTATGNFRLLDIFETNHVELVRSYVGRASGEVALTKFGVRGKTGMDLLRNAIAFGEDGAKALPREKEAFDQMAAEFFDEPYGTATSKWMGRAMQANTLVRLGGIVFNQLAESINGIFHVGAARVMSSVGAMPRLRSEIIALSKGQAVDNPFLTSIELAGGGAEFGTDAYKFAMPFDSPDHAYPTYGKDTLTFADRLLRGGGHLQSILSGWRMVHSAQQRGMAEQIVHKMMRYVRDGNEDVALDQFGITDEVRKYLRANLGQIATFDGSGNLVRFEADKIADPDMREAVVQSVWRGTSQIIQGTFIGERGKWAHDGWTKLLTQFRTFSITSMEKQWGRQRNSRGTSAAVGMILGSMSLAAPIYAARVYANSIGREDQDAYLEERLQPQMIARATLNYIAQAGMASDLIDLLTAVAPADLGIKPTGGRAGVESEFVGTFIAPATSLVDDVWKYAQSPTNVNDALKLIPGSRIAPAAAAINLLRE